MIGLGQTLIIPIGYGWVKNELSMFGRSERRVSELYPGLPAGVAGLVTALWTRLSRVCLFSYTTPLNIFQTQFYYPLTDLVKNEKITPFVKDLGALCLFYKSSPKKDAIIAINVIGPKRPANEQCKISSTLSLREQ